jgi:hypothetical protein
MKERSKWLVIEENGWRIIIPDFDSKPHSTDVTDSTDKKLAWLDCPCKPKIDWQSGMIIHNSFFDKEIIEKSMRASLPTNTE